MKHPLRVLSYNIHKGFNSGNKAFVLRQMRDAIRAVGADVVFLQEVLGEHTKHSRKFSDWPTSSQFEYLADSVWPHYAYGKNAVYDHGHHGNAILSKYPILAWSNYNISSHRFENRGLLQAWIQVPGSKKALHCLCVHLGLTGKGRRTQLKRMWERIDASTARHEPLLVAGDFNDWSQYATRVLSQRLHLKEAFREMHGEHPRTFPSKLPILKLDRIYYRAISLQSAQILAKSPWNKLSDHTALCADFGI